MIIISMEVRIMPRMGDDNKDRDDNDDGDKGCQGRPLGESTEDGDLQQCTMCNLSGSIYFQVNVTLLL